MQIEMLVNRDLKMAEFIDSWCSELRNVLNAEAKQDYIEVNFTTTEFNALMEVFIYSYASIIATEHVMRYLLCHKKINTDNC